jgi:dCMP deaminase
MRATKASVIKSIAEQFAELSTCSARAKVGAVLYDDSYRIVSTGYNGAPQGMPHCDDNGCVLDSSGSCISAVHAEVNAILQCAYYGVSTANLNMYCTHSPCPRCAVVLVRAGIKLVVYGQEYRGIDLTRGILGDALKQYGPGITRVYRNK